MSTSDSRSIGSPRTCTRVRWSITRSVHPIRTSSRVPSADSSTSKRQSINFHLNPSNRHTLDQQRRTACDDSCKNSVDDASQRYADNITAFVDLDPRGLQFRLFHRLSVLFEPLYDRATPGLEIVRPRFVTKSEPPSDEPGKSRWRRQFQSPQANQSLTVKAKVVFEVQQEVPITRFRP